MELFTTKKISNVDELGPAPLDTLPNVHIITSEVILRVDINDNLYIAESSDETCISNLIKIKKLLCKKLVSEEESKHKIMDDILWVKPSLNMMYKKGNALLSANKVVVNRPIKLQLSCKSSYIYCMNKPYNVINMFLLIDYIIVDELFEFVA